MAGWFDSSINRLLQSWGYAQPVTGAATFFQNLPQFSAPAPQMPTFQAPLSYGGWHSPSEIVPEWQTPPPLQYGRSVGRADFGGTTLSPAVGARYPARSKSGAAVVAPPAQYGASPPGTGSGDIWGAIDELAGDDRIAQAMKLAVLLESGGDANALGDNGQSHGFYQIYQTVHGKNITPQQSRDPYAATRYMLPEFQRAVAKVDPNLWTTDPKQAAALAAFYAERPAVMYDAARVNQRWGEVQQRPKTAPAPKPATGTAAWQQAYQNGTLTPDQFGAGLDAATAMAACGPAAAVAFARANGRTPTLPEAVELAKQVGWNPQAGMAGAQSQVNLLQRMGVQASAQQGVDWRRIQGELAAGRPVIIDTPRHYLVAEGYDPATGMFNFGNSGRSLKAAKGRSWFTPQQVAALGLGGLRSTIYMGAGAPAAPPHGGPIEAWTGGQGYRVTGEFGQRDPDYPAAGHGGMDIATPQGTTLTAGIDGTVVHATGDYNRGGYGNAVVLRTDDGHHVILGHLARSGVTVGQRVTPGMALGLSGSTGKSTGPHLHLEVRDASGRQVDPRAYFAQRRAA